MGFSVAQLVKNVPAMDVGDKKKKKKNPLTCTSRFLLLGPSMLFESFQWSPSPALSGTVFIKRKQIPVSNTWPKQSFKSALYFTKESPSVRCTWISGKVCQDLLCIFGMLYIFGMLTFLPPIQYCIIDQNS